MWAAEVKLSDYFFIDYAQKKFLRLIHSILFLLNDNIIRLKNTVSRANSEYLLLFLSSAFSGLDLVR